MEVYYKLQDLETVAMDDGKTVYIFDHDTGRWVVDTGRLLLDRLGHTSGESLGPCEQISKDEAQAFIGYEEDYVE